ncbi:MAG TPA: S4 domain-containing protein [Stellaceae bacterium]|nr:S4 domain-containing protein [Stellaceae bacterium]
MSESAEGCRIDVWLWRARFFKTRNLAARMVADGRVRLSRGGAEIDLDKPGRTVRCGDGLVLSIGGRPLAVRIEALGVRRGPAPEARALYRVLDDPARRAPGLDERAIAP